MSTIEKPIEIRAAGKDSAEVLIYDMIGKSFWEEGLTAKQFAKDLKAIGSVKNINVRINSPGGSVFDGVAIYNALKSHGAKITVDIDGCAASVASVIAMAGEQICMADGAMMMIHSAVGSEQGRANEMRTMANLLDKINENMADIYAGKTALPATDILQMMEETTWMDADEAVSKGFANSVAKDRKVAACAMLDGISIPERFRDRFSPVAVLTPAQGAIKMAETAPVVTSPAVPATPVAVQPAEPKAATLADIKAACSNADATFTLAQLEAGATLDQVRANWATKLQADLNASRMESEKLKALAEKPGVPAVKGSGKKEPEADFEGDAIAAWELALSQKLVLGAKRQVAVTALVREQPQLHKAYVEAYNERRKQTR